MRTLPTSNAITRSVVMRLVYRHRRGWRRVVIRTPKSIVACEKAFVGDRGLQGEFVAHLSFDRLSRRPLRAVSQLQERALHA